MIKLARAEIKRSRNHVVRYRFDTRVELANRAIVKTPGKLQVVFSFSKLDLEVEEIFVRLEIRIVLGDCDQALNPFVELFLLTTEFIKPAAPG